MHEPSFAEIHSFLKEMQILNVLQNYSFVNFRMWCVLKHFKTVREWWEILESGFCQVLTRNTIKMIHYVRFTDIHSSPKEMQPCRTCVSFGEECIFTMPLNFQNSTLGQLSIYRMWQLWFIRSSMFYVGGLLTFYNRYNTRIRF